MLYHTSYSKMLEYYNKTGTVTSTVSSLRTQWAVNKTEEIFSRGIIQLSELVSYTEEHQTW